MRYSFHAELDKVKKNASYILPEDINKPVEDYLTKIGALGAVAMLKKMRERIMYGTIEIARIDLPNAKITVQVDCGIADGWKEYDMSIDSGWTITMYKTIRNANIDKKRLVNVNKI